MHLYERRGASLHRAVSCVRSRAHQHLIVPEQELRVFLALPVPHN